MKADRGLTVERMTELARVSRASFYRFEENAGPGGDADMDLRDAIQRIALEWPSYGRRRITQELRRCGWEVNWKRVYRLMREDNLLCVRKRKFILTTDSNHGRRIWPNLAGNMVLTRCRPALAGGHYLHQAARRIRIFGRRSGCVFAPGHRLGTGPHAGR